MEKEFFTRRELTLRNEAEGELVYESELETTIECTPEKAIIKVFISKYQNYMATADDLWCEVLLACQWLSTQTVAGRKDFSDLVPIKRNEVLEKNRDEMYLRDDDPFLYMYFHSAQNWVVYENDDEYMFLYELPVQDMYELGIKGQISALQFWAKDDVGSVTSFLRSWFERVNGFDGDQDALIWEAQDD